MRLRGGWLGGLAVAACSLDTGGVASSGANTLGPGPGGPGTTDSTTEFDPHADSTHGGSGDGSGSADTVGSTTGVDSVAQLSLSGGPIYHFGSVALLTLASDKLMLTNVGGVDATGISGQPLVAPFQYTGGTYPGAGGTCGDTLSPGQTCELDLSFIPEDLGLHDTTLVLTYDQGPEITRELTGVGAGLTANLLINPGGEQTGSPPPGWINAGVGTWQAGTSDVMAHEGSNCHYAENGPYAQQFVLAQDVPVSEWGTAIDAGMMSFAFTGWGRTESFGDNQYRFTVIYQDNVNEELDRWESNWHLDSFWQMHSTQGPAPPQTRSVRVELRCINYDFLGDVRCNAYFDQLVLQGVFP